MYTDLRPGSSPVGGGLTNQGGSYLEGEIVGVGDGTGLWGAVGGLSGRAKAVGLIPRSLGWWLVVLQRLTRRLDLRYILRPGRSARVHPLQRTGEVRLSILRFLLPPRHLIFAGFGDRNHALKGGAVVGLVSGFLVVLEQAEAKRLFHPSSLSC